MVGDPVVFGWEAARLRRYAAPHNDHFRPFPSQVKDFLLRRSMKYVALQNQ
jgi:hypothetical protein